jgi:hypothetical protein
MARAPPRSHRPIAPRPGDERWRGRKAPNLIDGGRSRRVNGEHRGQLGGVAEHSGGRQAEAGHVRDGVERRRSLLRREIWDSTAVLRRGQLAIPARER